MSTSARDKFFDELEIPNYYKHWLLWELVNASLPRWLSSTCRTLLFADLFAGPGGYRALSPEVANLMQASKQPPFDPLVGSPLIALAAVERHSTPKKTCLRDGDAKLIACFCEPDPGRLGALKVSCRSLESRLAQQCRDMEIIAEDKSFPDSVSLVRGLVRGKGGHAAGLVFADPFGFATADDMRALLCALSGTRVDVLFTWMAPYYPRLTGGNAKKWLREVLGVDDPPESEGEGMELFVERLQQGTQWRASYAWMPTSLTSQGGAWASAYRLIYFSESTAGRAAFLQAARRSLEYVKSTTSAAGQLALELGGDPELLGWVAVLARGLVSRAPVPWHDFASGLMDAAVSNAAKLENMADRDSASHGYLFPCLDGGAMAALLRLLASLGVLAFVDATGKAQKPAATWFEQEARSKAREVIVRLP